MSIEPLALGRSKRSTAGNRMRELLEKAHQEDEKDELFAEEEDDDEFEAPQDVKDVFLDEFADTDEEIEMDEEAEEREIRREERRKAKGKGRSVYNPLAVPKVSVQPKQTRFAEPTSSASPVPEASTSTAAALALLDPSVDPYSMAPTTLALALRRQRREAKRAHRSEDRRSSMRASTLRTEAEIVEKELQEKLNPNRKGRRAQHETGEIRGLRPMTQDELIAAALEEEERNKEALRDWVRREEERRELRRVGRKRVRGARWSWISRTVGKPVEVVGETEDHSEALEEVPEDPKPDSDTVGTNNQPKPSEPTEDDSQPVIVVSSDAVDPSPLPAKDSSELQAKTDPVIVPTLDVKTVSPANGASATADPSLTMEPNETVLQGPANSSLPAEQPKVDAATDISTLKTPAEVPTSAVPSGSTTGQAPSTKPEITISTTNPLDEGPLGPYTRNYLILSQIPGGLPAELKVILGDHVEWDEVKVIPARNRPINRRPPICQFTGLPAKYRHPTTMVPYANISGYKQIEALLAHRYVWSEEGGCWFGGEEDMAADGIEEVEGWKEHCNWGWIGGKEIVEEVEEDVADEEPEIADDGQETLEEVEEVMPTKNTGKGKGKRKLLDELSSPSIVKKKGKGQDSKVKYVSNGSRSKGKSGKGKASEAKRSK